MAYKLKLLDSAPIHPVFHVSQLKRSVNSGSSVSSLPLGLEVGETKVPSPEAIVATRGTGGGMAQSLDIASSGRGILGSGNFHQGQISQFLP